jgi:hypothetical protein
MFETWELFGVDGPVVLGLVVVVLVALVLILWQLRRASVKTKRKSAAKKIAPPKIAAHRGRPEGTTPPPQRPRLVLILAPDALAAKLSETIDMRSVRVKNLAELISVATRDQPVASFVDVALLPERDSPDRDSPLKGLPIIGVLDAEPADTLSKIVHVLASHPSMAHVIVAPLLTSPLGRPHIHRLLERLAIGADQDLLGAASVGRVAMLAQASRREARFERMQDYFSKQGVSSRTIAKIYEVAEELVMNALYNAPAEAGFFKNPVSRIEDVTLPPDRACEISYGMEGDTAFVRLRDTFGALRHDRLLEVLRRCNSSEVALDESRGGAGLGIWRVFSAATTIEITVIPGRLTDILIRMSSKQSRSAKQLLAVELHFLPDSHKPKMLTVDEDSGMFDNSITIMQGST